MHAHGDATVTYTAVMATLNAVIRMFQIVFFGALVYGVFRLFLSLVRKATTLPCSHGFADTLDCLDCSHPDWFAEVEASRLAPAPVVEPEVLLPELSFSGLYELVHETIRVMGFADTIKGGAEWFKTDSQSGIYLREEGTDAFFTPRVSRNWKLRVVSQWAFVSDTPIDLANPEHGIRVAVESLMIAHARRIAEHAFTEALVPKCPECGALPDGYEIRSDGTPCNFAPCTNPQCPQTQHEWIL
jgi:hypothetical protein